MFSVKGLARRAGSVRGEGRGVLEELVGGDG